MLNTRPWTQIEQAAEEASVSFRDDGAAALDWAARYLERVGELPVLAQVEPGEIRGALPASPPEDGRAVRRRAARPRRGAAARRSRTGRARASSPTSRSPASEPGILAELLAATLNQVGILWRTSPALDGARGGRRSTGCAQLLGLPGGWHGHIEDTASTSTLAALIAARQRARAARRRLLRARALVGREGGAACSGSSCARFPPTTSSACAPTCSTLDGRAAPSSRRSARRRSTSVDPVRGDRGRVRSGGRVAARRRGVRRRGVVCPEERWSRTASSARTRSSSTRTSGCSRRWTARCSGRRGRTTSGSAFSARARVPAHARRGVEPQRVRACARAAVPRAEALGGAALLRRARGCRSGSARRCGSPSSSRSWVRGRARAGSSCAPRRFSLVCFRRDGSDEENEALARARERERRDLHLAHEAGRPLRAAARGRQRAHDRGGRAARLGRAARERAADDHRRLERRCRATRSRRCSARSSGSTVRSRNVGSQFGAGLKSIVGGELKGMTKALVDSRQQVMDADGRGGGGEGRQRDRRDALRHVGDGRELDGDLRLRHRRARRTKPERTPARRGLG